MNKEQFKYHLTSYVNSGCFTAFDKLACLFFPKAIFRKNAALIQKHFQESKKQKEQASSSFTIRVNVYDGKNKHVLELINFLETNLKDQLAGAYVHGSLGTQEEIAYSDMDALVILKDEIFLDKKKLADVAMKLSRARSFMLQLDPLQHHGWFVMTESDLLNYSETYFPSELFRHAKSLLKNAGLELKIQANEQQDFRSPLTALYKSIESKLNRQQAPGNLYELKNLLSEFMLLPAFYVQARDKKGIYKKFSFEEARKDFPADEWRIMDEVSLMRQNWSVIDFGWKRNLVSNRKLFSFNMAKVLSPPIATDLKKKLTPEFYQSMSRFTKMISEKIK